MDRIQALAYLNDTVGTFFTEAGRLTDDSPQGFKPVLDSAFQLYINENGLSTGVTDTDTSVMDLFCFQSLLKALSYDYIMPHYSVNATDFSIDAPLTNVKRSQSFRQVMDLRNQAWADAGACGYGSPAGSFDGFKVCMDFTEPTGGSGSEYG